MNPVDPAITPDPPALLDVVLRGGSYGMVPARRMGYGSMSRSVDDLDFVGFRTFIPLKAPR